jgi:arylsulfatase A-like enzyme
MAMTDRLNVLVVVLEGVRADHLSGSGYARATTPFLDALARDGVRFSNMIATSPGTLSSHAALFTGVHSVTHGATGENRFLSSRHKSLQEYLKSAGYRAAAFCTNPWVSPETGFGRGFDAFFTQRHDSGLAALALLYGRRASDRILRRKDAGARRTNEALKRWLADGDQPFFAFMHLNETHLPYRPPPPYDRVFLQRSVGAARVRSVNQDANRHLAGRAEMSEEDFAILTALYDGALRYVDHRLNEIADFLRACGEWDRTLLVVTADHGEHLGEHGLMGHRVGLYDAVLRVPLVVRCPERVPQGFVVEDLAETTDIAPTILRLLDITDDTAQMQGRALFDGGRATAGPAFTVSERFHPDLSVLQQRFPYFDARFLDVRTKAIRTRREKFIWRSDEANEFYDLTADPGERTNVIEHAAERADALRRQLFDWLAAVEKFETDESALAIDDVVRRQLQGLGYLD